MKYVFPLAFLLVFLTSCDRTSTITENCEQAFMLPQVRHLEESNYAIRLSAKSRLYTAQKEIQPLLELFSSELKKIYGIGLETSKEPGADSDIIFETDSTLKAEEYQISCDKAIRVRGGSYHALTLAKTTLIQLMYVENNALQFPLVHITDYPDASYRGLMIDLARGWHEIPTIKKIIDLAAFYKIRYLQLHFSDYQSYTLPSHKFPKLSTENRSYSYEELRDLENYSQLRGITIIPEIDIPGHSSPFVEKYPEIFAIKNIKDNPWIINMGKEDVYKALDEIIGELVVVFKATPYIHIGGDEAIFYMMEKDPDVQEFMKKHELGEDIHELYRYFLVRLNETVKSYGKQMCVWEGFTQEGNIKIPKDIIVFEFETNRYLPNDLVKDGYTVVNTSWKPLYVVNQKKWEPKTIYNWNMWRWENWFPQAPSFQPIQLKETPLVIGAQMCAWEQAGESEIPSLRKRLPAFSERIWNSEKVISYDELMVRINKLDKKLSLLIEDDRQDKMLLDYNFEKEAEK